MLGIVAVFFCSVEEEYFQGGFFLNLSRFSFCFCLCF